MSQIEQELSEVRILISILPDPAQGREAPWFDRIRGAGAWFRCDNVWTVCFPRLTPGLSGGFAALVVL